MEQREDIGLEPDLGPDCGSVRGCEPSSELLERDTVVDDLHPPGREALVVDQGLADRLADGCHSVVPPSSTRFAKIRFRRG